MQLRLSLRSSACPTVGTIPARSLHRFRYNLTRATTDDHNEFEGVGGNRDLQDALVEQLRVQVENQTLKEEIKEDLKERVEGLKQIGEELIQRLDDELSIEKFRTDLESSQVLSEANEKFNELEEQLQQIKDQIKADQADLRAFEAASASARSQGLFFKNLYQPELDEGEGQEETATSGVDSRNRKPPTDPVGARAAAAVVTSSAEEEVSRPFRMYLFGYMAAVLALVVAQDLTTSEPKYALDALYGVLGLLLGINTLNERNALAHVIDKQQQRLKQAVAAAESASKESSTVSTSASYDAGDTDASSRKARSSS